MIEDNFILNSPSKPNKVCTYKLNSKSPKHSSVFTPHNGKANKMKSNNTIFNEFHNYEGHSTCCKSLATDKGTSTAKKRGNDSEAFVRPFGLNSLNTYHESKKLVFIPNQTQQPNFSLCLKSISLETKPKKKVMQSSEELLLEKIEKERQEFEKLKKTNRGNVERLFNQTSLLSKKRDTMTFEKKPSSPSKSKEQESPEFEADFLSLTNSISRMSFASEVEVDKIQFESALEKTAYDKKAQDLKEKLRKKEDKMKQMKKQSVINKLNFNHFGGKA